VLTAIMAAAHPLSKQGDPKLAEWADAITEAAEMGARISAQLLVLGREQPAQSTRVSLAATLDAVLPVLRARFGDELEVHSEITLNEPVVIADPAQIERVLLNLCVNAGEASGGRGRVDVRVREPRADEARGRGWLVLEVSDQGVGMSEEVKDHLFEPYFTTKPSGTGLGLASVYGIVKQLKGRIHAESVLGRGSSFVVTLPLASSPATSGG
jgi:two-component system, cell cycle sensor histidine kinase and response regulator CckA